jgi:hypothetical protein
MNSNCIEHLNRCLKKTSSNYTLDNRERRLRYNGFDNYETLYFKEQNYVGGGWEHLRHRFV